MDAYLAERQIASGVDERDHVAMSLELLSSALNNYGHEHLSRADTKRFIDAFEDAEDEDTFSRMFGVEEMLTYIDEFVSWFLIRKVIMPLGQTEQTIEDVRGFVEWLAESGEIGTGQARKALGAIATASIDVPSAERLAHILHDLARRSTETAAAGRTRWDETIEDYLVIERVAPGRIWFIDGVGPIKVPEAASALARPGWTVSCLVARVGTTWHLLETGNVYPETLA